MFQSPVTYYCPIVSITRHVHVLPPECFNLLTRYPACVLQSTSTYYHMCVSITRYVLPPECFNYLHVLSPECFNHLHVLPPECFNHPLRITNRVFKSTYTYYRPSVSITRHVLHHTNLFCRDISGTRFPCPIKVEVNQAKVTFFELDIQTLQNDEEVYGVAALPAPKYQILQMMMARGGGGCRKKYSHFSIIAQFLLPQLHVSITMYLSPYLIRLLRTFDLPCVQIW